MIHLNILNNSLKDLISGRKLGTGERWFRGLLASVDIVPGLGAAKKFMTTGKVTSKVTDFSKKGMTLHRTKISGKMELVPFGIHNITMHNGGRSAGMWADATRL